nr:hypothetical protein [Pseudarthrobacter psychrotolerans]
MNSRVPPNDRTAASQQGDGTASPTAGMPLGARRLVLVGGLCIPVGLLAGSYLFGLQLLAVAGVVAISVALSYGTGRTWFALWPRVTAGAGAAWIVATIAYWLTVVSAADVSAPVPEVSSVLLSAGVVAFMVMAAAVLAGTVARFRSHRHLATAAA